MKEYVIDKVIFLIIGIGIMIILPRMCGYVFVLTIVFELMAILSVIYLCRHILILPLDFVLEKRTEDVYFSKMSNIDNYEFFSRKCYCEWKFYSSKGTLNIIIPVALTEEEVRNMERPSENQKVRICYYRFSKIMYSWERI